LSLAEVLVALGLFAMIALGIVAVVLSNLRLNRQGDKMTLATQMARTLLETTKSRTYANITVGTYDGSTPANPTTGFPPPPYPGNAEFRMKVVAADYSPAARSVQVDVSWGTPASVRLYTLVHQ
jgi:Tfp pilus assembly protein PilV